MVSAYYGGMLVLALPGGWLVDRFGLRTMPAERPSLERAESLYAQTCAVCHNR